MICSLNSAGYGFLVLGIKNTLLHKRKSVHQTGGIPPREELLRHADFERFIFKVRPSLNNSDFPLRKNETLSACNGIVPILGRNLLKDSSSDTVLSPTSSNRMSKEERAAQVSADLAFLAAWFRSPLKTGAVTSSGRMLAAQMAAMTDPRIPGHLLELGPGTGPVTSALLKHGYPEDRLILVEMNNDFRKRLERRFPNARVVGGDAFDMLRILDNFGVSSLSAVVSSLPLLLLPEEKRHGLLGDAFTRLQPGGGFVQFTYGWASPIPVRDWFSATPSKRLWWNLPPAVAWRYMPAAGAGQKVAGAA